MSSNKSKKRQLSSKQSQSVEEEYYERNPTVIKIENSSDDSSSGESMMEMEESSNDSSSDEDEDWSRGKNRKRLIQKRKKLKDSTKDPLRQVEEEVQEKMLSLPPTLDFNKLDEFYLKIAPSQISKRNSLSLTCKMDIVGRINAGESQASIAKKLKLNRSTVQNIWANRDKWEKFSKESDGTRKKCRMPISTELESLVLSWIEDMQKKGTPPNGPQIRDTAVTLAKGLGLNEFTGSPGWLDNFKQRNKIVLPKSRKSFQSPPEDKERPNKPQRKKPSHKKKLNKTENDLNTDRGDDLNFDDFMDSASPCPVAQSIPSTSNKSYSGNAETAFLTSAKKLLKDWIRKTWSKVSESYSPNNIFFIGEFSLFYKVPPEHYKIYEGTSCQAGDYPKERLGILYGTNLVGTERLKLVAVGSSKNPASFGGNWNQDQNRLPTEYWCHPSAFVTAEAFEAWLLRLDAQMEQMEKKSLVVLANSDMHKRVQGNLESSLKYITIVILPPTFNSSALQGLEREIVWNIKFNYRTLLLNKFVRNKKNGEDIFQVSVLDAQGILSTAWMELEQSFITEVFKNAGLITKENPKTTALDKPKKLDEKNLLQLVREEGIKFPKNLTFQRYVSIDENVVTVARLDDTESGSKTDTEFGADHDAPMPVLPPSPMHELLNNLDRLRSWAVVSGSNSDLNQFHDAISTIQMFCNRNPPPASSSNHCLSSSMGINPSRHQSKCGDKSHYQTLPSTVDADATQIQISQNILSHGQYNQGINFMPGSFYQTADNSHYILPTATAQNIVFQQDHQSTHHNHH